MLYQDHEGGNIAIISGGDDPTRWEMDSYDGFVFRIFNQKSIHALSFSWDMSGFNIGDYTQILNGGGYTIIATSGDHFDFKNISGNLVNIGALGFAVGSSRRYKENIHHMADDRAKKILDLDIVTYDYRQDYVADAHGLAGVIAEDCISVIPEAVLRREIDGKMQPDAVDYTRFIPYLIKMVQIQQEQIRKLQDEVASIRTV